MTQRRRSPNAKASKSDAGIADFPTRHRRDRVLRNELQLDDRCSGKRAGILCARRDPADGDGAGDRLLARLSRAHPVHAPAAGAPCDRNDRARQDPTESAIRSRCGVAKRRSALYAPRCGFPGRGRDGNTKGLYGYGAACPNARAAFKLARLRCCLPAKAGEPANNASAAAARTVFLIINFMSSSTRALPCHVQHGDHGASIKM